MPERPSFSLATAASERRISCCMNWTSSGSLSSSSSGTRRPSTRAGVQRPVRSVAWWPTTPSCCPSSFLRFQLLFFWSSLFGWSFYIKKRERKKEKEKEIKVRSHTSLHLFFLFFDLFFFLLISFPFGFFFFPFSSSFFFHGWNADLLCRGDGAHHQWAAWLCHWPAGVSLCFFHAACHGVEHQVDS